MFSSSSIQRNGEAIQAQAAVLHDRGECEPIAAATPLGVRSLSYIAEIKDELAADSEFDSLPLLPQGIRTTSPVAAAAQTDVATAEGKQHTAHSYHDHAPPLPIHEHNHNHHHHTQQHNLLQPPANGHTHSQHAHSAHHQPMSRMAYNHKEEYEFNRLSIGYTNQAASPEHVTVAQSLIKAMALRQQFLWHKQRDTSIINVHQHHPYVKPARTAESLPPSSDHHFRLIDGVYHVYNGNATTAAADSSDSSSSSSSSSDGGSSDVPLISVPTFDAYLSAYTFIYDFISNGESMTFCHNRLHVAEARFNLHSLLNSELEQLAQKAVPHRDFYNVRKIDNHVHHSAAMNQKHLLRYIKKKLKTNGNDICLFRDNQLLSLSSVFLSLKLTPYDLNIDTLDMHATQQSSNSNTFFRFDKFNNKYNPVGESRLREIFLKYDNYRKGEYLAEITQQVFEDLENNKYQYAEYRLSIYGTSPHEWQTLADWVTSNNLFSPNVRWVIQIPRLYRIYKNKHTTTAAAAAAAAAANGTTAGPTPGISCFQDMLSNIFLPLFEASRSPQQHVSLFNFLSHVVAFDMVDDESLRECAFVNTNTAPVAPAQWTQAHDPNYAYYTYYIYANLYSLNNFRSKQQQQQSTFQFRPHAGEAGDPQHLVATYLCCNSINHGLLLMKSPPLQYLYMLSQVGVSMSPLSNNVLFLEYNKNPFPRFFARGLHVALSTDDPLMIHVSKEPLIEEYSVAAQVWKLSGVDCCELARNSVLQSGFDHRDKAHWLGNHYYTRDVTGNDIRQTNVPDLRIQFRHELLMEEHAFITRKACAVAGCCVNATATAAAALRGSSSNDSLRSNSSDSSDCCPGCIVDESLIDQL